MKRYDTMGFESEHGVWVRAADAEAVADALRLFVTQWNACGPNSDFGRYFQNVRDVAVKALGDL